MGFWKPWRLLDPVPSITAAPESGTAAIEALQQDPDFLAAYNNAEHSGHRAAVMRLADLRRTVESS